MKNKVIPIILIFERVLTYGANICAHGAMLMLSIMTVVIFALVVTRYLFSYSFPWVEELSRYLMIWMTFLAAGSLMLSNSHIKMDFVYTRLSQRWRNVFDIFFSLLQMTILGILIFQGWRYAQSVAIIDSPALGISMRWPSLSVAIGSTIMIVFVLYRFIRSIIGVPASSE